jgi:hypothetical protein
MVIAVRTVFVTLLELLGVLPEALFALLAGKGHVEALLQRMVGRLAMAFCTVEPFPAWMGVSIVVDCMRCM